MKKWLLFIGLLSIPAFSFAISPRDESENYLVHFSSAVVDADTNVLLLDLSDQTTFKHLYTGGFIISDIVVTVDRTGASGVTSSTGIVKIGVVNTVNVATGSVSYFYELIFNKVGSFTTPLVDARHYAPSFLNTRVVPGETSIVDGLTPYLVTNSVVQNSTSFQTDVSLLMGNGGAAAPGIGDIILSLFETTAGSYSISVDIFYHSRR